MLCCGGRRFWLARLSQKYRLLVWRISEIEVIARAPIFPSINTDFSYTMIAGLCVWAFSLSMREPGRGLSKLHAIWPAWDNHHGTISRSQGLKWDTWYQISSQMGHFLHSMSGLMIPRRICLWRSFNLMYKNFVHLKISTFQDYVTKLVMINHYFMWHLGKSWVK